MKMLSAFMSAAYTQVHFRLEQFMESNLQKVSEYDQEIKLIRLLPLGAI